MTTLLAGRHPAQPRGGPSRGRRGSTATGTALLLLVVAAAGAWAWLKGSVGSLPIREHCVATVGDTSVDLDPEQAGNAATIAAVAVTRGLPARAATIGIATADQESHLRNIDYGDRDSLGLFQQRPSQGWGTAEQVQDPVYAANAFYDVLVKIEGYRDLEITDAAQKVQRSAFPSAYADHEPEARVMASALTGYSPAAFECVLRAPKVAAQEPAAGGLTPRAQDLADAAERETNRSGTADPSTADPKAGAEQGTAVRFSLDGADRERLAWSLAQWAVARAKGLDVVAVEVDGRQWRRDQVDAGWEPLPDGPSASTVVVRVAAGD